MTKDEIGLLLSCIEGDDKELEKYSENKLAKLGFPLEQIEKRKHPAFSSIRIYRRKPICQND